MFCSTKAMCAKWSKLDKKSTKKAFAVSRSAKAVRPKGQQTCEKHVYVLIIRCKFTFSMKSRIELLKRFATRRFCCFRRKTWFSEKKSINKIIFSRGISVFPASKMQGTLPFFTERELLTTLVFAKEILENR